MWRSAGASWHGTSGPQRGGGPRARSRRSHVRHDECSEVLSRKQLNSLTGRVDEFPHSACLVGGPPDAGNAATMRLTTCRLRSIPLWPTPPTVTVSTSAWVGTDRRPGTIMSSVAVTPADRMPSGTGAERFDTIVANFPAVPGLSPQRKQACPWRTPEGCPEGDDRVDLPGEATTCDGLRDHDPAQAVSDQCTWSAPVDTTTSPPRRRAGRRAAPPRFRTVRR